VRSKSEGRDWAKNVNISKTSLDVKIGKPTESKMLVQQISKKVQAAAFFLNENFLVPSRFH